MTPELKGYDCSYHDPIDRWVPDGDEVLFWLTLHIGEPGRDGADLYTVPVATVPGLKTAKWKQRPRSPGTKDVQPIVLREYTWEGVLASVRERLQACSGYAWLDVQDKLRHQFAWEYEGMR